MSCRGTAKKRCIKIGPLFGTFTQGGFCNFRPFSRKKGGKEAENKFPPFIPEKGRKIHFPPGRRAEGGFYPGPTTVQSHGGKMRVSCCTTVSYIPQITSSCTSKILYDIDGQRFSLPSKHLKACLGPALVPILDQRGPLLALR